MENNADYVDVIKRLKQSSECMAKAIKLADQLGYVAAMTLCKKCLDSNQNAINDLESKFQSGG